MLEIVPRMVLAGCGDPQAPTLRGAAGFRFEVQVQWSVQRYDNGTFPYENRGVAHEEKLK
jgi:hypothetical protein